MVPGARVGMNPSAYFTPSSAALKLAMSVATMSWPM